MVSRQPIGTLLRALGDRAAGHDPRTGRDGSGKDINLARKPPVRVVPSRSPGHDLMTVESSPPPRARGMTCGRMWARGSRSTPGPGPLSARPVQLGGSTPSRVAAVAACPTRPVSAGLGDRQGNALTAR